jgi:hypothetical protein
MEDGVSLHFIYTLNVKGHSERMIKKRYKLTSQARHLGSILGGGVL